MASGRLQLPPIRLLRRLRARVGRLSAVMVVVLLVGMLPMTGLLWLLTNGAHSDEKAEARSRLMHSASFLAGMQADALATVEFTLSQLSGRDASWALDLDSCEAEVKQIAGAHPFIAGLAVLRGDGVVHCTMTRGRQGISLADRPFVRQALREPGMAIGEPLMARISGQIVLPVAIALRHPPGGVEGPTLLSGTLDLGRVANAVTRVLNEDERAADGRVKLFDASGQPLLTYPPRPTPVDEKPIPAALLAEARGSYHFLATDGTERMMGFASAEAGGLIWGVSLVTDLMLTEAHVRLRLVLAMAVAAALVGVLVALALAHARILRPLALLTEAARGGPAGRLPTERLPGEFEVLRTAMGRMMVDVAHREAKLRQANQDLARLADRDALTGLPNRRRFDADLAEAWERVLAQAEPLAIVVLDVDHFKKFNDRYGHLPGDTCLRKVAEAIEGVRLREQDVAARLGGEEFVLLLPRTDTAGAMVVAERALAAIRDREILHEDGVEGRVTASAGVAAAIPMRGIDPLALLTAADAALYAAKAAGRNRAMSAAGVATLVSEQTS
jgi:diguanylate cyclase (GGDEF)-like protein